MTRSRGGVDRAAMAVACACACAVAILSLPAGAARLDVRAELAQCAACHGDDGRSTAAPQNGRIAGQNIDYLVYILKQYRAGRLKGLNGGVMTSAMRHLEDAQIVEIARHYAEKE